jgi:transposase-like protein
MLSRKSTTSTTRRFECLTKDRDVLLAIYDFPAEHWKHLRPTTPCVCLAEGPEKREYLR